MSSNLKPDPFAAVRGVAMGDLSPEDQDLAHELWMRENLAAMQPHYREAMQRLFNVIDRLREGPSNTTGISLTQATPPTISATQERPLLPEIDRMADKAREWLANDCNARDIPRAAIAGLAIWAKECAGTMPEVVPVPQSSQRRHTPRP
ncbi:MAG: hypothetical protein O9327_03425 [Polaromonas sp.]|nr:hypothetical protein [Polaromonas sp.]